jgi:hypothetical protein
MAFGILALFLLALAVVAAVRPLKRTVVCPKCRTKNSSIDLQCPNCQRLGPKGKVSAGGIGPAHVTWACPACKTILSHISCKQCGNSLETLFTT